MGVAHILKEAICVAFSAAKSSLVSSAAARSLSDYNWVSAGHIHWLITLYSEM